jgi:hypothetical protein
MKKLLYFWLISYSFLSFSQEEKQVLFIGNSYTYYNNLPELIHNIALSKGNSLNYNSHTPGGSTLMQHASNANVQSLFTSNQWDYIVLQEQSQRPAFPPSQVMNEVYPYATSLCEDMREANSCVQPVFFMTWGRENGDQQNCQFYEPLCTYEGMQDRLITSYTEMAQENESLLAPVGVAWKNIREEHPEIDLYTNDGSHPSIQGSYLSACIFYSVLFNDSALNGFVPDNMDALEAEIIQTYAFEAIEVTTTDYTVETDAQAIANYEVIGDSLYLYNLSTNSDSINWVGVSQNINSTEDTLTIDLKDITGVYEINLIAMNDCSESTFNLQINDLSIVDLKEFPRIYPNPSNGILNCNLLNNSSQTIAIYNSLGVCLFKEELKSNSQLDFSHLSDGVYTIHLIDKTGKQISYQWLKKN